MSSPSESELLIAHARQDMASGQLAAAQAKCLQALGIHHHHPGALEVLGEILCAQGRHEDAVRVFNALTVMQPTVAGHWQNLGTVLRPTRRYALSLAAFEHALNLGPPSAGLLYNLGVLQMDRCDYRAAYVALRDAVALSPADATIRWAFAQCCYDAARLDEALAALEDWQTLEGLNAEAIVLITLLLVMMGAMNQAQPAVERLLADPPLKGRPALGFASILERLHRLDEARAVMREVDLNHRRLDGKAEMLLMSAVLADRAGMHEEACRLLTLALKGHTEFAHRYTLLFPLAKNLDALGRYDEAYAAAEEAHRSQLAFLELAMGKSPDQESSISTLTAISSDPDDIATWDDGAPAVDDSPIFIVGFPRSGTTLLEQVLDAHPRLQSMDEQPFLLRALREIGDQGVLYPAGLGRLSGQALDEVRAQYWQRVRQRVQLLPGQRLVDKNPLNMLLLPLIRRIFPKTHLVLVIRHPCDTVLSCFLQQFRSPGLALACRDLPTLSAAYSRAFGYWYSQWPLLHPLSYELQYEQLTLNFEREVRGLCAFLQVPCQEAMLAPAEHARARGFISTPSYAQVTLPVSGRSVGRWRRYEPHFRESLDVLMPWIERWGYGLT